MRTFTIEPLHAPSMEACRLRIDNLTKPIYSLATLELIAERFAGILADPKPNHLRHGVLIVAADHLVDGPQNSQPLSWCSKLDGLSNPCGRKLW